jgi:hypothetical protein
MHDGLGEMDAELHTKWKPVERHLRAAVAEVDLENTRRAQVEEFLDHNELGVAFEWIVGMLAEPRNAIPDDARQHLAAAAAEMQLETNPDWQRLQARG